MLASYYRRILSALAATKESFVGQVSSATGLIMYCHLVDDCRMERPRNFCRIIPPLTIFRLGYGRYF